ncbi:MAG: C10 family peptidase [Bacteroidales bacterium]|nr:C10 family peptidase [Bacteroidales bacterium]
MKKILAVILTIGIATLSYADNVSQSRAESLAKAFFGGSSTRSGDVSLKMVWDGTDEATRSGAAPAFYVFNRDGGGYVVIAGEDAAEPVLAYSETGSFNPDKRFTNVRGWFRMYQREIEYMRANGIEPDSETAAAWSEEAISRVIRRAAGKNLNTKSWGQDAPYNLRCPLVDGLQSVTGCVATALCEVMRYHEWPVNVSGSLPSYKYKTDKGTTRTQPGHRLDTTYNWAQMPNSRTSYTGEQAQNVSRLMFDVAVMLQSSFNGVDNSAYGTGAYSENIVPMMVKYMDYDSSAVLLYRDNFSTLRWAEILKAEIDAGRPMPYSGDDNESGHQFVVDGYDATGKFHINWGWDGEDNNYYAISSFRISRDYDFRYNQSAVIGLQKNKGGKPHAPEIYYYVESGKAGVSLKSGSIESGNFTVTAGDFYNFGAFDVTADFAFVLLDFEDNAKTVLSTPETVTFKAGEGATSEEAISLTAEQLAGLRFGDRIAFCYKVPGGQWTTITVDSYSNEGIDAYPVFDAPAIKVNATATYSASDLIPLKLFNYRTVPSSVTWYIDGSSYSDSEAKLSAGKHTIRCVAKFPNNTQTITQTLIQEITVQ